jgi:small subunit ribosomal protein S16
MLKIRLQKIGKKNSPSYRVALVEHTTSPQGKFIELLGSYNPRLKTKNFKKERIEYWLSKGAQASPTVFNLLVDEKIINREKLIAWKPKKKLSEAKSSIEAEKPTVPETPKIEEIKAEEPKVEETKPEEPKIEEIKPEESQLQTIDTEPKKE